MKLYIRQKIFSFGAKFNVTDEFEEVHYKVEGEIFTLVPKLHIYDTTGYEVALVRCFIGILEYTAECIFCQHLFSENMITHNWSSEQTEADCNVDSYSTIVLAQAVHSSDSTRPSSCHIPA